MVGRRTASPGDITPGKRPLFLRVMASSSEGSFACQVHIRLEGVMPRALLVDYPGMPASVLSQRVGWLGGESMLRRHVARRAE